MIPFRILLIGFCCFLTFQGRAYSQDLLDYSNSLKYADYLYQTGQFKLASVEFERVVFLEPDDTLAKLKLIRSYRYTDDYSAALDRIEKFFPRKPDHLPEEFSDEFMKLLLHKHRYEAADAFLETNLSLCTVKKKEYELGILALQNQWSEAGEFLDRHGDLLTRTDNLKQLNALTIRGMNTRYKSPALATSLSVILPGSGKLYTKKWKDAIYSFLAVSACSWITYKSYVNNGLSVSSVLLGSLTLGFYSANIYGSYKSAVRFNQSMNQSYTSEAEQILLNDHRINLY